MGWAKNIQESNETWPYKIKIVHFIDSCLFCLIVVVFLQRATFTNEDFEIFVHSCFQSYRKNGKIIFGKPLKNWMDKLKKSSYNIFGVKIFWQQVFLKIIFNSRGLNITGTCSLIIVSLTVGRILFGMAREGTINEVWIHSLFLPLLYQINPPNSHIIIIIIQN